MSSILSEITFDFSYGTRGSGNGEFNYPSGIIVLNDEIFIVDKQNNRIQVFTLSGNYIRQFGSVGSGNNNFFFPEGIATDGIDLYIVDGANHRIKKHQIDGTFISEFGTEGSGNTNFKYPIGINIDNSKIYISDKQNHRIKIHNLSGTYLSEFGSYGFGNSEFNFPEDIQIFNDQIIVADSGNKEIKIFNSLGAFQFKITSKIFGYPTGLTNIDNILFTIVDKTRSEISLFDEVLSLSSEFGSPGTGNNQFFFPQNAFYYEDKIYITDSGNHRIKVLNVSLIVDIPKYSAILIKLTKQLYPTGRAWWMNFRNIFYKLHEGLSYSESRVVEDSIGLLNSIIPDSDNFTTEDATNWERALGLFIQSSLDIEDRKQAILRKMAFPGTIKARQHYLYLQGQLQDAGFDVYVHENRIDLGGGQYGVINPVQALHGNFNHGDNVFGNAGIVDYTTLANYTDETKDASFSFGNEINLRATFLIGGSILGIRADIPELRKNEFRELILKIKPTQTAGFLLIDYI